MQSFHYISVLLDMMYGLELEDQDVEEYGLIAWELIGNRNRRLYRYQTCINPKDNSVTLPCNALDFNGESCIEAVTTLYEDWERVTNYSEYGDNNTSFVEQSIEAEKFYQSPYYIPGKLLKYEQVGDKLYFTHNYGKVNILYKGILVDDEGLPEITDKEATAIATYIAYVIKFKEGLQTNNPNITQQANLLYSMWLKQCDQARVTYLNQNDMNNIIDIKSSWDRKSYGKTFKPIR